MAAGTRLLRRRRRTDDRPANTSLRWGRSYLPPTRNVERSTHESSPAFGLDRARARDSPCAGAAAAALCRPRGESHQGAVRTADRRLARGARHGLGARGRAQRISRPDACARIVRILRSIRPAAREDAGAVHSHEGGGDPLGERLIAQEADLDKQFANQTITPASLA